MSSYQHYATRYWLDTLTKLAIGEGQAQSAGSVAKAVGQSRTTAKKYMKDLVSKGLACEIEVTHFNGSKATLYTPMMEGF